MVFKNMAKMVELAKRWIVERAMNRNNVWLPYCDTKTWIKTWKANNVKHLGFSVVLKNTKDIFRFF